jgi:starch synthase
VNILMATSEATPFAKTGGLADMCGWLPIELARLGHQVTMLMPAYRQARECGLSLEPAEIRLDIPIGNKIESGTLLKSQLPGSDVPVYLVEHDGYFGRRELYREGTTDYRDNCERFAFFCRAVMESVRLLDLHPDIIHAHDWQTGLIPAYLEIEYRHAQRYAEIASVFTIHNMAYQGQFWHWDMLLTGLDWKFFNWHQMEFYGNLNLLKTGIVFADAITTVSPTYAQEIQSADAGYGLENVLQQRRHLLTGIINGVDYAVWDPSADRNLASCYSEHDWQTGKAACKAALQEEIGLPAEPHVPLIGFIGRLAEQKGVELIAEVIQRWSNSPQVQWVILGQGEPAYHERFADLRQRHPDRVAVQLEFSDPLAHRIEAGADIFLMPSRYEPCGLNQLFSLKYGAVPVVHSTGGLADTIVPALPENIAAGTATGFAFHAYQASALESVLAQACRMYAQQPSTWAQLVTTGMKQDWSWAVSARQYLDLYASATARRKQPARA